MGEKVLASTLVAPKQVEVREYDMPDIPPDAGHLKVERCGVCGTDAHDWQSVPHGPQILGHENTGYIARG